MIGAICGPVGYAYVAEERREPERWCFKERRRQGGTHRLMRFRAEDVLSGAVGAGWAEPYWDYRCDGCNEDHRLGFGWVWVAAEEDY
jgi:hypothetical protein